MVSRVHKYQMTNGESEQAFEMHPGAVILSVQAQNNFVTFWVEEPEGGPRARRRFRLFATGEEVQAWPGPAKWAYKGTAQLYGGTLVLHLYEYMG